MTKYIILNGPPGSGKDAVTEMVLEKDPSFVHAMFKESLYEFAARTVGLDLKDVLEFFTDRNKKEMPCFLFQVAGETVSPRKYLQHISENVVKPLLGEDFFGRELVESTMYTSEKVIVSDGGFLEELNPLCEDNEVIIVEVHRKGCSFEGDTRDYISDILEGAKLDLDIVTYHNNGTLEEFRDFILSL